MLQPSRQATRTFVKPSLDYFESGDGLTGPEVERDSRSSLRHYRRSGLSSRLNSVFG